MSTKQIDEAKKKKIYVCFRFPDPTYAFGPILNILLC